MKIEISICTGLMLNDHSNPYIESTTVLSDTLPPSSQMWLIIHSIMIIYMYIYFFFYFFFYETFMLNAKDTHIATANVTAYPK